MKFVKKSEKNSKKIENEKNFWILICIIPLLMNYKDNLLLYIKSLKARFFKKIQLEKTNPRDNSKIKLFKSRWSVNTTLKNN